MKKCLLLPLTALLAALTACSSVQGVLNDALNETVYRMPETVTVENVVYRGGFYGELYPDNIPHASDACEIGGDRFYHVDCEQFDWLCTSIGGTSVWALYCAESQWEQAKEYYADLSHFTYYCTIGAQYVDRDPVTVELPEMDPQKFDELMAFAGEHAYDPFDTRKEVETQTLPRPGRDESPRLVFYRESRDGFFTTDRGYLFHIVDGTLFQVYYYQNGGEEEASMLAIAVPEELGAYFMELLAGYGV